MHTHPFDHPDFVSADALLRRFHAPLLLEGDARLLFAAVDFRLLLEREAPALFFCAEHGDRIRREQRGLSTYAAGTYLDGVGCLGMVAGYAGALGREHDTPAEWEAGLDYADRLRRFLAADPSVRRGDRFAYYAELARQECARSRARLRRARSQAPTA